MCWWAKQVVVNAPNKIQRVAGAAFGGIDDTLYKVKVERRPQPPSSRSERQLGWRLELEPWQFRECLE